MTDRPLPPSPTRPLLPHPAPGRFANTGDGPTLQPIDIGHPEYSALIDPDTAFWALVRRDQLADVLGGRPGRGGLLAAYARKSARFAEEMRTSPASSMAIALGADARDTLLIEDEGRTTEVGRFPRGAAGDSV